MEWLTQRTADARFSAEDVALQLQWPRQNGFRRALFDGCLLLTLGEEPALAISDSGDDPLAFAYHSGYEWVLDTRPSSTPRLSNTRWRRNDEVYHLGIGSQGASDVLDALTPRGFEDDRLQSVARKYLSFDTQVATIESALIRKLGELRKMAFRFSAGDPTSLDREIHLFITQLFVLRAIEDLGLAASLGLRPLKEAVDDGQLDVTKLHDIYLVAREKVQPRLFDHEPFPALAPIAIAATIDTLYQQSDVPESKQLNFAWIDPDVFGRVYERYLSTVLAEAPPPIQGNLFENPLRGVEETTQRRQGGVYYTPQPLVRILVQKAIDITCPEGVRLDTLPRIADFACGSGAFLAGALDKLLSSLPSSERTQAAQRIIKDRLLVGVDIDDRSVALARLNIYLRLAQENEILPLPDVESCVVSGDSLGNALPGDLNSLEYDAVVGNPPFLSTQVVLDRNSLPTRFTTAVGRYDYSSLFVELALKQVRRGGAIALVVPNRLFLNSSAQVARDFIVQCANLNTLVDFGSSAIFEGVSVYVGLLISQQRTNGEKESGQFRFIRVRKMPSTYALEPVARAIFTNDELSSEEVEAYAAPQPRQGDSWISMSPRVKRILTKLEEEGCPLNEVAELRQGIKTGANYIYILRIVEDVDGSLVRVEDSEGRKHLLERAILRPVATGSEISRYRLFTNGSPVTQVLLYPHDNDGPIPESKLKEQFPSAYQYMLYYKLELESRISVRGSAQPWYSLVRPRDDEWLSRSKILSRDLIAQPSFAVDLDGGVCLIGGVAILPSDSDHLLPLAGILNSQMFELLLRSNASEYKGSYFKVEPGRLMSAFIPKHLLESQELYDLVRDRLWAVEGDTQLLEQGIDAIVAAAIG